MAYNDIVARADVQSLIPEDVQREIIQGVPESSAIMRLGRRLPDMVRNQRRMPILTTLVTAAFVTGDNGLKQTSQQAWDDKYIDAEELAVIVPIPENVLDDADYDVWGEIRPRIVEAFGIAFDAAVLFGTNAPASWPDDLLTAATAASNSVDLSASTDIFEAVLGTTGVNGKVELDGFDVTGHVAALSMRAKYRGLRDGMGNPIFMNSMQAPTQFTLDGSPVFFPRNGAFDAAQALQFSGDWSQLVWAIRKDITFKILDQAIIQDGGGNIVFNLAQQDMLALRCTLRLGWQVPNPINRIQPTTASRFPFAVLVP